MKETTMKKSILFISYEEAQHICDKSQYSDSTVLEKIKLMLRYLWCRFTKAYVTNNTKLTKAINVSNVQGLHFTEREQLLINFNRQLKKEM